MLKEYRAKHYFYETNEAKEFAKEQAKRRKKSQRLEKIEHDISVRTMHKIIQNELEDYCLYHGCNITETELQQNISKYIKCLNLPQVLKILSHKSAPIIDVETNISLSSDLRFKL